MIAYIIVFGLGMIAGISLQVIGELIIDIKRGRKELKRLRQKQAETQAERLKEAEATTM